jgi:hypothetical protein
MKAVLTGFGVLVLGVASVAAQLPAVSAAGKPDAGPKWEYRVLTKAQVLDLGKKDLATGLNQLGDDGWELVAVDAAYIFKRIKNPSREHVAEIQRRIALIESEVDILRDRVAWAQRMAKKGFLSDRQLDAERLRLQVAESVLDEAQKELQILSTDPKEAGEKKDKPAAPERPPGKGP